MANGIPDYWLDERSQSSAGPHSNSSTRSGEFGPAPDRTVYPAGGVNVLGDRPSSFSRKAPTEALAPRAEQGIGRSLNFDRVDGTAAMDDGAAGEGGMLATSDRKQESNRFL